jgi:hypothetical protein
MSNIMFLNILKTYIKVAETMLVLLHLDLNPAAQGSSLTEGKRGKRSKKANGESNGTNGTEDGGRSSDNDSNDQVVEAPVKVANENVSIHVTTCFQTFKYQLSHRRD